jgi:hypothetical protein
MFGSSHVHAPRESERGYGRGPGPVLARVLAPREHPFRDASDPPAGLSSARSLRYAPAVRFRATHWLAFLEERP